VFTKLRSQFYEEALMYPFYNKYFSLVMTFYRLKYVALTYIQLVVLTVYLYNNYMIAQQDV